MKGRTTAVLLVAVVALGAMAGVAAADGHLNVSVETDDAEPTVNVTDENGTAVENATVVVSVVDAENESYAGAGEYETDANGTVDLPAPEEDVTVEVTAASGNDTASTTVDLEAPDGLELGVENTDGEPVVTVTDNDTAVENASVNVTTADENASYAGTGDYETDENGTVDLPAAEEDVTVNVTAEYENESVTETVDLEAPDGLELDVENTDGEPVVTVTDNDTAVENASVVVALADDADENASYAGTGDYETDENGTVELPAAEENVTVEITAEYENETVSTTVDLTTGEEADEEQPFGLQVREFIESLEDREGGIGAAVSDFVTENNPGNAPDHAGGPGGPDDADDEDADAENESDAPGNAPDHAGPNGDDGERGPPDHAGPDGDDDADDEDAEEDDADDEDAEEDDAEEDDADDEDAEEDDAEEDDEEDEDDEDDGERGPPDHAGGPGGN